MSRQLFPGLRCACFERDCQRHLYFEEEVIEGKADILEAIKPFISCLDSSGEMPLMVAGQVGSGYTGMSATPTLIGIFFLRAAHFSVYSL